MNTTMGVDEIFSLIKDNKIVFALLSCLAFAVKFGAGSFLSLSLC